MIALAEEVMAANTEAQVVEFSDVVGIGDTDRRQAVKRPGRKSPVKKAVRRGPFRRLDAARRDAKRRVIEIVGPLDDAPVHQARTNAGAKKHRDPAKRAEFRGFVGIAEPDAAETAGGEP